MRGGGIEYRKLELKEESILGRFFTRAANHIKYRLGIKTPFNWDKSAAIKKAKIADLSEVDIIHTFNTICDVGSSINWCCTFESETPVSTGLIGRAWERDNRTAYYLDPASRKMLLLCAKSNCKGLIAISSSAYRIQYELIERSDLSYRQKRVILNKLVCIHPPQEVLINREEFDRKYKEIECLRFVFVGHDFFRKGGKQILNALKELYSSYQFTLKIISKLIYGDYASASTENDYLETMELIHSAKWIEWYPQLSNKETLDVMKQAHIGLLPSIAETYGYSVLEMQAMGCACVTTNIRALGEINNDDCGWVCNIDPNEFGESIYGEDTIEYKKGVQEKLQFELSRVFDSIFQLDTETIRTKALRSIQRIEENHNPAMISEQIKGVYDKTGT